MRRGIHSTVLLFFLSYSVSSSQQIIAELKSKSYQRNIEVIPLGDRIFLSYEELVGPTKMKAKQVKWVGPTGNAMNLFCPVEVFAITAVNGKIYYYYRDEKLLKTYVGTPDERGMNSIDDAIELNETIVSSFVDGNLFLILLSEDTRQISIVEIAGMNIVNRKKYSLPIALDEFIKKNTYIEYYDDNTTLNFFKGRSRIKLFQYDNEFFVVIDDHRTSPTNKNPNQTHVLRLDKTGAVDHTTFLREDSNNFGSYLVDGKLFQSVISRDEFTLLVYDLSSKELLTKKEVVRKNIIPTKTDTLYVNLRYGRENQLMPDTFDHMMKRAWECDPVIVVSKEFHNYNIQWGTYGGDNGAGTTAANNPVVGIISFLITTTILQTMEPPGISRYAYYQTDLGSGKFLDLEPQNDLRIRSMIDNYEQSKQTGKHFESPFESKSYIAYKNGIVGAYKVKPKKGVGSIQLVYFE